MTITITKVESYSKASEAIKEAEASSESGVLHEIRQSSEQGDKILTIDDLKKIAEEEAKDEAESDQPVA